MAQILSCLGPISFWSVHEVDFEPRKGVGSIFLLKGLSTMSKCQSEQTGVSHFPSEWANPGCYTTLYSSYQQLLIVEA